MTVILSFSLYLVAADFSICAAESSQAYVGAIYAFNQYNVFWRDRRSLVLPIKDIYGARVSRGGTVLDPDGKLICSDSTGYSRVRVASDGSNMLVVFGRN